MNGNYGSAGQETKTKPGKLIISVILIVLAVGIIYGVFKREESRQEGLTGSFTPAPPAAKVTVPEEWILGEKIHGEVKLEFPDPNNVSFVQYRSQKPHSEIVSFYTKKFSEGGWNVTENRFYSADLYQIIARNERKQILADVKLLGPPSSGQVGLPTTVAILFRKL